MRSKLDTPIQDLAGEVERIILKFIKDTDVPGISVAILRNGECVWAEGFGVKNTHTAEPMTPETVFCACSLSKPAAAYAALTLCEAGQLNLETPLDEYLPSPFLPDDPLLSQITLPTVLSHSSGLPHGRPPWSVGFRPGSKFSYSSVGYDYMQRVVEHITGMGFADFMRERFLDPLRMTSSSFLWRDTYNLTASKGHDEKGKPLEDYKPDRSLASNTLFTTPSEYARFLAEMIHPSERDNSGLGKGYVEMMVQPHVRINKTISWGLGWGIQHGCSGESFWQWGWFQGFRNFAVASRENGSGVVVMTNGQNGSEIWDAVVKAAIGGDHPVMPWRGKNSRQREV